MQHWQGSSKPGLQCMTCCSATLGPSGPHAQPHQPDVLQRQHHMPQQPQLGDAQQPPAATDAEVLQPAAARRYVSAFDAKTKHKYPAQFSDVMQSVSQLLGWKWADASAYIRAWRVATAVDDPDISVTL